MPCFLAPILRILMLASVIAAYAQSDWTFRNPSTLDNPMHGVAWTGSQLVAVGDRGRILTSPDGIAWTRRPIDTAGNLRAVTWTGSLLVAVGDDGLILTSPDGVSWTLRKPPVRDYFKCLLWTGSNLLAAGGRTILSSTDGITWTSKVFDVANTRFASIAYSGSMYVVAGGLGNIATSPDGVAWTIRQAPEADDNYSVTWTDSLFIMFNSYSHLLESRDGIAWTLGPETSRYLMAAVWNGKDLLTVGRYGEVKISPAGRKSWSDWATMTVPGKNHLHAVIWTGTQYVAVGAGSIVTSPDGHTWTQRVQGVGGDLRSVYKSPAGWTTSIHDSIVFASVDGVAWTRKSAAGILGLHKVQWTGTQYLGLGSWLYTSPDAMTWTRRETPSLMSVYAVASHGKLIVAAGDDGEMAFSENDGVTWTSVQTTSREDLTAVVHTGSQFVAVGYHGLIITSPDGKTWTQRTSPRPTSDMVGMVWTGTKLVVMTDLFDVMLYSTDGVSWTEGETGSDQYQNVILWTGSQIVIAGGGGSILTSRDGTSWTKRNTGTSYNLSDLAAADGQIVAVGEAGTILTSPIDPVSIRPGIDRLERTQGRFLGMDNGVLRIGAPAGSQSLGALHASSGRRVGDAVSIRDGEWRVPLKGVKPGKYFFTSGKSGTDRAIPVTIPMP